METESAMKLNDSVIRDLISAAQAPTERAMLTVLLEVNNALTMQIASTDVMTKAIQKHETLVQRLSGAWMVIVAMFSSTVMVGGWYVSHYIVGDNETQTRDIRVVQDRVLTVESQMKAINDALMKHEEARSREEQRDAVRDAVREAQRRKAEGR